MTITLTYSPQFAGVDIDIDDLDTVSSMLVERSIDQIRWTTVRGGAALEPGIHDTLIDDFNRTATNGWGTSPIGGATTTFGGAAGDYSVTGGQGRISNGSVAVNRRVIFPVSRQDVDITVKIDVSAVALTAAIGGDVIARWQDSSNFYTCRLIFDPAGAMRLNIFRTVAGVETDIVISGIGLTYTTEVDKSVRYQISGSHHRAKAWDTASGEPADWIITGVDASITAAGSIGVGSRLFTGNTNALPVIVDFDDLEVSQYSAQITDYEFKAGVPNFYRVTGTKSIDHVIAGAAVFADNGTVVPALPVPNTVGDLLLSIAGIHNDGGSPNIPTDYTAILTTNGTRMSGKVHDGTETAPSQSFSGGAAGDTTGAAMVRIPYVRTSLPGLGSVGFGTSNNASQQNITSAPLSPAPNVNGDPVDGSCVVVYGYKEDDWTSVLAPAGFTELVDASSILGDDAGLTIAYMIQETSANIPSGVFTVTGGASATAISGIVAFAPDIMTQTGAQITPPDQMWLKSVTRPFLNRQVPLACGLNDIELLFSSEVRRRARAGIFPIKGRTYPVAVTDVWTGREWTLRLATRSAVATQTMDYYFASGDVLYIQVPSTCTDVQGGYVVATDATRAYNVFQPYTNWTVPLVEVAAPGPDVIYAEVTWQTVLDQFADWAAVLAANASWADLFSLLPDPSEVIVP
jgi:hypothetical protein